VYLRIAEGPAGFNKLKVVKQLRPDLASEPQFSRCSSEEARSPPASTPTSVQTFEVAFDGQRFYLEMEYLEGQSLDGLARRLRRLDRAPPRAVGVWIQTQVSRARVRPRAGRYLRQAAPRRASRREPSTTSSSRTTAR